MLVKLQIPGLGPHFTIIINFTSFKLLAVLKAGGSVLGGFYIWLPLYLSSLISNLIFCLSSCINASGS